MRDDRGLLKEEDLEKVLADKEDPNKKEDEAFNPLDHEQTK